MLVTCKNCSKEFDKIPIQIKKHPNNFCSQSCAAKFNNKGRQRNPPIQRKCRHCGESFYSNKQNKKSKVLCSKCRTVFDNRTEFLKTIPIGDYQSLPSVKGKHTSWKNSHIRILNRLWNHELTEKPCAKCGYDKHVELCHIKPITQFSPETTIGEVNAPSNNIQLCRNCHWELDNKLLKLKDIKTSLEGFEPPAFTSVA